MQRLDWSVLTEEQRGAALARLAGVAPVVVAHLERHLDRSRAVVGVEAAGEAGRGDLDGALIARDPAHGQLPEGHLPDQRVEEGPVGEGAVELVGLPPEVRERGADVARDGASEPVARGEEGT